MQEQEQNQEPLQESGQQPEQGQESIPTPPKSRNRRGWLYLLAVLNLVVLLYSVIQIIQPARQVDTDLTSFHSPITTSPPIRTTVTTTAPSTDPKPEPPDTAEEANPLPLTGKTIVCFGDSLFGMNRDHTSTPSYLAKRTGGTVYNVGFGGCRMSHHPYTGYNEFGMSALADAIARNDWTAQEAAASQGSDYFPQQLKLLKSIDFEAVDIIVIHYGTNDFTGGIPIESESNPKDTATLTGALRHSIETIQTAYPQIRIYVSLPVYRYFTAEDGTIILPEDYYNAHQNTLIQFVEAIRAVAGEYQLPVIDGYYGLGVDQSNAKQYLIDGTHHTAEGRKRFGYFIGSCILADYS